MTKTVLFDLDGTLLDTEIDFTGVLNTQLSSYGMAPVFSSQVRKQVSSGAKALIKLGFKIDESDAQFSFYLEEFLDLYLARIANTKCVPFPGIEKLLADLEQAGCVWGIVTNKPSRFTLPLLKNFSSFKSSHVVICADQLNNSKPDPEGLLKACEIIENQPANTLYVGDHLIDVQAASAAGATSIAVRWGYIPEEIPIDDWHADHLVSQPHEILPLATA